MAIDAAIWIVEAITQAHLRAHFDSKSAVLKVLVAFSDTLCVSNLVLGSLKVSCWESSTTPSIIPH